MSNETPLTAEEVDEMRRAHVPSRHEPDAPTGWCEADDYRWPCDAARAIATLDAARQSTVDVEALDLCDKHHETAEGVYGCILPMAHEAAGIRGHHWASARARASLAARLSARQSTVDVEDAWSKLHDHGFSWDDVNALAVFFDAEGWVISRAESQP